MTLDYQLAKNVDRSVLGKYKNQEIKNNFENDFKFEKQNKF